MSLREVRSPLAPKMTIVQGSTVLRDPVVWAVVGIHENIAKLMGNFNDSSSLQWHGKIWCVFPNKVNLTAFRQPARFTPMSVNIQQVVAVVVVVAGDAVGAC